MIEDLFSLNKSSQGNPLFGIITTSPLIFVFSIISTIILFHYFKKKNFPEIFFFVLFILSLSLQTIRLFQIPLLLLNISPYFGVIITRLFYFFKFFGLFCLFATSLFPIGIKFQKFEIMLLTILLLSFTISALMPIDPTTLNVTLLYKVTDRSSIFIMIISIRLLTIINFVRVAVSSKSKNYLFVLISAFFLIFGDDLMLFIPFPFVSLILLLIGTAIYTRSIYSYYLWI